MKEIKKVAVLGAGVMGSGIAAHLAGAGLDVVLLDIVPPAGHPAHGDASQKNLFAQGGKDKALKSKPAAFFTPRDADRITIGNFDDDLAKAGACDLVIEVVKEDLGVKKALFDKLIPVLADDAILASNTSGLPIRELMAGRPASVKSRFLVTHFFNPVRYMKLLELVAGEETSPAVVAHLAKFGAEKLGKGIVFGKDTPNFVANRIGVFGMMHLMHLALEGGYTVEEVDAIFGPAMGRPKSAVFRTADVVGLDTLVEVAHTCYRNEKDERRSDFQVPTVLTEMVKNKWLGDKTGGGFGKKTPQGIMTLDLKTLEYRPQQKAKFESVGATKGAGSAGEKVKKLLAGTDRGAELARKATYATLAYSSNRIGEIADDLVNVDRAMRWGFGWDLGPFETWDALGVGETVAKMKEAGYTPAPWVDQMLAAGQTSFYGDGTFWDVATKSVKKIDQSPRDLQLPQVRKAGGVVWENDGATLFDLGDRILGLEFHTKMNAIDADIIAALYRAVDEAERNFDGLVIANHDKMAFSAGANIFLMLMAANQGNWKAIEDMSKGLQDGLQRLRYATVPTVTAPFGLALGGGAEVTMHGARIRANAELYMGLVEAGVGLIPAGGGCKELLCRNLENLPDDADPFPFIKKVFMTIAMGKVSISAEDARAYGFLGTDDGVTLNRDYLIHDAKQTALGLFRAGYRQPRPRTPRLPGKSGYATLRSALQMMAEAHQISAHDVVVGSKLAGILTGGDTVLTARVTEQQLLDLEREAFLSLAGEEKTRERMQYMLMNNKPLRN